MWLAVLNASYAMILYVTYKYMTDQLNEERKTLQDTKEDMLKTISIINNRLCRMGAYMEYMYSRNEEAWGHEEKEMFTDLQKQHMELVWALDQLKID